MNTLRRSFLEGLVVLTPILLLAAGLWWLYSLLSTISLLAFIDPPVLRVGLALAVFMMVVFSLGYLMRTAVGRLIDQRIHDLVNRFPIIRVIYNAVKLTLETALPGEGAAPTPVKIEAWNGCRMAAFKTGHQTADGRAIIFIPGAPEVTSGFVAEVDPDRLIETDDTLMDVLVRLLSCGFGDAKNHDR